MQMISVIAWKLKLQFINVCLLVPVYGNQTKHLGKSDVATQNSTLDPSVSRWNVIAIVLFSCQNGRPV